MGLENEVKFEVHGFADLKVMLKRLGAEPLGCFFEHNLVLDTPQGLLKAEETLLRLRQAGNSRVLCLKRPPESSGQEGIKVWQEWETEFADWTSMLEILKGLGFTLGFSYEKVRETWRLDSCLICLDLLPFGRFVEIEGPPGDIFACAAKVGLDRDGATTKSYHQINQDRQLSEGRPSDPSFTFSEPERSQLIENQTSLG